MLTDKYSSLIDMANTMGVENLTVNEGDGVLHIDGTVKSDSDKKALWDEYGRIDPDYRSGDLVLNIASAGGGVGTTYTVQSGDTLSGIGSKYGVSWQDIFEANRDVLDNPDLIHPGQTLKIPGA
ncbi:MAG TPA: LysM peptidoglycan-binding domain-containing protein [Aridibacter sp.]|nr:LysM peptidoglycan-binding domain-containing protein [Aridibacter sp.]